jgi:hypothetical protein
VLAFEPHGQYLRKNFSHLREGPIRCNELKDRFAM